jgi:hypothetical protein
MLSSSTRFLSNLNIIKMKECFLLTVTLVMLVITTIVLAQRRDPEASAKINPTYKVELLENDDVKLYNNNNKLLVTTSVDSIGYYILMDDNQ